MTQAPENLAAMFRPERPASERRKTMCPKISRPVAPTGDFAEWLKKIGRLPA